MYDLVYILGAGSKWSNNEIRYSLRSVEQNLRGYRDIWIVGERPDFVTNVHHLQFPDSYKEAKDANIVNKVLRACCEDQVSENFLIMHDDYVILNPIDTDFFKHPFVNEKFTEETKKQFSGWFQQMEKTKTVLKERGLNTIDYNLHAPKLVNKKKFLQTMLSYAYAEGKGLLPYTLYYNTIKVRNHVTNSSQYFFGVNENVTSTTLNDFSKTHVGLYFNDHGVTEDLKSFLTKKFPVPSRYELSENIIYDQVDLELAKDSKAKGAKQIDNEFAGLIHILKKKKIKNILEIGAGDAGSLYTWKKLFPKSFIVSLDMPYIGRGKSYLKTRLQKLKLKGIETVIGNSHDPDSFYRVKKLLGKKKVDLLFIDGDHTYNGVREDFQQYSYFVKDKGLILFHDISEYSEKRNKGVKLFWDEIKQKYFYKELNASNLKGGGIGILVFKKQRLL